MTKASELFNSRRCRLGRNSTDLGFDSALDRNLHHHHHHHSRRYHTHNHHYRYDADDCDPFRRPPHIRHLCHRVSQTEREAVRLGHGSSQSGTGTSISAETSSSATNTPRFSENDRLPGAVLLARERLLERLRGLSLSGNSDRQSSRASSGITWDEFAFSDDFRPIDAGDWENETPREWLARGNPVIDSTSQTNLLSSSQDLSKKKPPGLSQEDVSCLHWEVFSNSGKGDEMVMSRAAQECSICLERFLEGDRLICLLCGHRFHSICLHPWVQTCGDCPYCRTGIVIGHHRAGKTVIF